MVGNFTEASDKVVIGMSCGCSDSPKKELDAIKRLGGEICTDVMEATLRKYCKGQELKGKQSPLDLGYAFSGRVEAARSHRKSSAPYQWAPEPRGEYWNRLFTASARRAAGPGFDAIHVVRNPVDPDPGFEAPELQMRFGNTTVGDRFKGKWSFDEFALAQNLVHSSGHTKSQDGKHGECLVCDKRFANFDAHTRKSRHIGKVIEGVRRAMFQLRKKKYQAFRGGWQ
jgi:hypothetical protein